MVLLKKGVTTLIRIVCLILISIPVFSQSNTKHNTLLIRNVRIIEKGDSLDDVKVSILIKDGNLHLITKDKIPIKDANIAFDAKNGIIMGNLEVGEEAGFMIVGDDPRENIDVLLDSKSHTIFAIYNGQIVLNALSKIQVETTEKRRFSGWRSYAPPPIALPISYQNKRKWNVLRTKPITALFAGVIGLENTRWLSQSSANREQVGPLDEFEGGSIRGIQIGSAGTFNFKKPWTYLIFIASGAYERGYAQTKQDEFILYEYRVDIPLGNVIMSLGKQKEPIGMQRLFSLIHLPANQERASMSDGFLRSRNTGILFNGTAFKSYLSWAVGAFNPWFEEGKSFGKTNTVFAGRVTVVPLKSVDESNMVHFGLAGRYSNAAEGIQYRARTEIYRGPFSIDTERFDAKNSFTLGLELAWRMGPLLLFGEYLQANVKSSERNDPSYRGFYVTANYVLTGEMRSYNKRSGLFQRVPVSKSVSAGGWGAWDIYVRWSSFNLKDEFNDGGLQKTFSIGLNWWATSKIQWNISYRYGQLDRFGAIGVNHGIVNRLTLLLD